MSDKRTVITQKKSFSIPRAKAKDLQIVREDFDSGHIRYAVSLHGCKDFAWFYRKCDAERFVQDWEKRESKND